MSSRCRAIVCCGLLAGIGLPAWAPTWLSARLGGMGDADWWRQAAFGTTGLRLLALLGAAFVSLCIVLGALARLSSYRGRQIGSLSHQLQTDATGMGDAGTAMIEFALLFPVALLLFLVVIQTAFMYTANFYVNLAAFRAARAAIVWAEHDRVPPSPDSMYTLILGPEGIERIEAAAKWTCVGISGTSSADGNTGAAGAHDAAWTAFIGRTHGWAGEKLRRRYEYAQSHTRVRVRTMPRPDPGLSEWNAAHRDFYRHREPITVEVAHDFELSVPYAKWVLGSDTNEGSGAYHYVELQAACTLVNEGQPEVGMPPRDRRPL